MKQPHVLCVRSDMVERQVPTREPSGFCGGFPGWLLGYRPRPGELPSDPDLFSWQPREPVETDPTYRQVIPYVLLQRGRDIALYRRTALSSEARLHDKISLGFGGHVEPKDEVKYLGAIEPLATLLAAGGREVSEELEMTELHIVQKIIAGVIVSNEGVSRYHLAVVERWILTAGPLFAREPGLAECQWVSRGKIYTLRNQMEGWAQTCADLFIEGRL